MQPSHGHQFSPGAKVQDTWTLMIATWLLKLRVKQIMIHHFFAETIKNEAAETVRKCLSHQVLTHI